MRSNGGRPSARLGHTGRVQVTPLKDDTGWPTQVVGAAAMAGLQLDHLDLARADRNRIADVEMRLWMSGGSGTISSFNWSV